MVNYISIIDFWVHEIGPKGWYNSTPELDAMICDRFMADWQVAHDGGFTDWADSPKGCLAYLILTDQFPRNMFRDDARAFATDPKALGVAVRAIKRNFDMEIEGPAQQFFYMPYEHSETPDDQLRAIEYMKTRMRNGDELLLHARVHQEIIRKYGRFPYRNKVLGRMSTKQEQVFLDENGYQGILEILQNMPESS